MQKVTSYWGGHDEGPTPCWPSGTVGFHENPLIEFPEDSMRIVGALLKIGYTVDPATAAEYWEQYSFDMDAGWMVLPETDKGIIETINEFCFDGKLEIPTT